MVDLKSDLPLWGRRPAAAAGAARADRQGLSQVSHYLGAPPQSLRDRSPGGGVPGSQLMGISRIACNLREQSKVAR